MISGNFGTDIINSGNISIETSNDSDFEDCASFDFVLDNSGLWLLACSLTLEVQSTLSLALGTKTAFRLKHENIYATSETPPVIQGMNLPLSLGIAHQFQDQYCVYGIIPFPTDGTFSVKLQKKNTVSSNISTRQILANTDCPIQLTAHRLGNV